MRGRKRDFGGYRYREVLELTVKRLLPRENLGVGDSDREKVCRPAASRQSSGGYRYHTGGGWGGSKKRRISRYITGNLGQIAQI